MLLIWVWGSVVDGAAGRAVRSAKATIPFRPTFVSHGVGVVGGLPHPPPGFVHRGYPARLISSTPPSSYTANAYLPITVFGGGAGAGPWPVSNTQSGAVKLATGELSGVVMEGLSRGIR